MKKLQLLIAAVAATILLAGCAGTVSGVAGSATPLAESSALPASAATNPSLPCSEDPTCNAYVGTSAVNDGSGVASITDHPPKAEFYVNGTSGSLVVSAPCVTLDVPLTIKANVLIIDVKHIARTTQGCAVDKGQAFISAVLSSSSTSASIDSTTQAITVSAGSMSITFTKA
jgi:hypothetical protein